MIFIIFILTITRLYYILLCIFSAIAAKITIMIAYCKNDPKNAISSTCLSAMADTYALQKCKPAHNLNIIAHFVLYRQGIQRLFFALSLKIRVFF
jgi:hypothetical protein